LWKSITPNSRVTSSGQRQCWREFLEKFPEDRYFLEKLYVQQKLNQMFHLKPIVQLASIYRRESLTRAFALAREYNTFTLFVAWWRRRCRDSQHLSQELIVCGR